MLQCFHILLYSLDAKSGTFLTAIKISLKIWSFLSPSGVEESREGAVFPSHNFLDAGCVHVCMWGLPIFT